jgi:isoquinoline 1-oxidoreductase beta subunit
MKRRNFLQLSTLAGGGFLLSIQSSLSSCATNTLPPFTWKPNFFIEIDSKNKITFLCTQSELGQGTSTGLSMVAADELGANLEDLTVKFAAASAEKYGDLQGTGGSNGMRTLWLPLRNAAATTREILKQAAAHQWNIDIAECYAEDSFVYQKNGSRKIAFGKLLETAATLLPPRDVQLKDKKDFKYIGKPISGKKNQYIVRGQNPYSINMKLPNMVYAAIERCPVWKGTLRSFDDSKARNIAGVIDIFAIEGTPLQKMDYRGGVRPGVVVVAENTWAAFKAKAALDIQWDMGINAAKTDEHLMSELETNEKINKKVSHDQNNASRLLKNGTQTIKANYLSPFQANACMEPLNAVAFHKGTSVEVWVGTQAPTLTRSRIAELTQLPIAAITVHNQPSGGGFGRRYFCDFAEEAVIISEKLRQPVKVTWSREDTIRTNKYHPLRKEFWSAKLDANNHPIALEYNGVVSRPNGYRPYPYNVPTVFHPFLQYKEGNLLPRSSWRSVFAHPWSLSLECFIDELAHHANEDPIAFRLKLIDDSQVPTKKEALGRKDLYLKKLKHTLLLAKEKAKWGNTPGIYQGVSAVCYNDSYCTQIADISFENDRLKIHKFTAVIDCGFVVNPSQVKSQIEGSIIWGLSAVLHGPITVKNGRVEQNNFDDYPLLRMSETPEIEVFLVDSEDHPNGTGEPAVPGVAPAVLNAIFAATGKRIRAIPVKEKELLS